MVHLAGVCIFSTGLGLLLTYNGILAWDDVFRYSHSCWLLHKFSLSDCSVFYTAHTKSYSSIPLELVYGIATEIILPFLNDPYWIRHSINFALFPITTYIIYLLSLKVGCSRGTSILFSAAYFGIIRLGGHALINVKDFPYAAVYVFSTFFTWLCLLKLKNCKGYSFVFAMLIGVVSVAPFLFKRPDVSHFVFSSLVGLLIIYSTKEWSKKYKLLLGLSILFSGFACLFLFYPPFRDNGLINEWLNTFETASSFNWGGPVRFWGITAHSKSLPWWYSISWLPVIAHPIVTISAFIGLFCLPINAPLGGQIEIKPFNYKLRLSIRSWILFFVCLTWAAILIIHPNNYEEERHILFIYPLIYMLGISGLDFLKERVKYLLSAAIVILSLISYVSWNKYSYIYLSPFVRNFSNEEFSGEYKKVCLAEGITNLKDFAPNNSVVAIYPWNIPLVKAQYHRLKNSLFFKDDYFPNYLFVDWMPKDRPFYSLSANRIDSEYVSVMKDIEIGEAEYIWSSQLPSGDTACLLAYYE